MACPKGAVDLDDDPEKTNPMIRTDLPLYFVPETRSYHHIPPGLPDSVEIANAVLRTEDLLGSPDAHAIRAAGLGPELKRFVRMLATHSALVVTAAIKNALYGDPH